jgi:hypothetical protein
MVSIIQNDDFISCESHAFEWEKTEWLYYKEILCCKIAGKTGTKIVEKSFNDLSENCNINDNLNDIIKNLKQKICILPKNHIGRCSCNPHKKLFKNKTINCKLDWIYTTPGNNDFIFKNRHDRLFPIKLSDDVEKDIRNKNKKLKCAIPLKDASTPEFMASAYLDYLTLILNVKGIDKFLDIKCQQYKLLLPLVKKHKIYMINYYKKYNRIIFNHDGMSICPVIGTILDINDFLLERDDSNGIQLGHVKPRTCKQYAIRGGNVLLMTREGNRIVGDNDFLNMDWLDKLFEILKFQDYNY